MTTYRITYATAEGTAIDFVTLNERNFLIAERKIAKTLKKNDAVLIACEAWFE